MTIEFVEEQEFSAFFNENKKVIYKDDFSFALFNY